MGELNITEKELHDAVSALWGTPTIAYRIINHVKGEREPDWQPGDVVKDANGTWWRKTQVNDGWYRFGYVQEIERRVPKRPLTKMGLENI